VFVRGEQIYRDFPSGVIEPEWTPLKVDSKPIAIAWHALNKNTGKLAPENSYQRRNISLRIKNFAIGERGIYSSNDDYSKQQGFAIIDSPENLDWYIGEVHILDNEIIPNTSRKRIEDSPYSRMSIAELRKFYNVLTQKTRVHSTYISAKKHIVDARKTVERFQKNSSDEELDALKKAFQYLETDDKKSKINSQSLVPKEQAKVLSRKELRDERRVLIKEISKILEKKEKPKVSEENKKKVSTLAVETMTPNISLDYDLPLNERIAKPEELFQAVITVVSEVLGEDSEEYKTISQRLENLFQRAGLF
jgi:hypothetical protein